MECLRMELYDRCLDGVACKFIVHTSYKCIYLYEIAETTGSKFRLNNRNIKYHFSHSFRFFTFKFLLKLPNGTSKIANLSQIYWKEWVNWLMQSMSNLVWNSNLGDIKILIQSNYKCKFHSACIRWRIRLSRILWVIKNCETRQQQIVSH